MIRVLHIFKELARNLWRNPGTALSSFLSLALMLVLFDLFWVAAGTSQKFYTDLLSDMQMELFVDEAFPDSLVQSLERNIVTVTGVKSVDYVSKDQARDRLGEMVGIDLLVGYEETNPLPRSFILSFWPEQLNSNSMSMIDSSLTRMDGIESVYYGRRWLEKAESTRYVIRQVGMVLGILILVTALISSANSIRLMARARASGFQQARLLGAGKLFLSFPFIIEGLLLGLFSSAAGWWAIYYSQGRFEFSRFAVILPPLEYMIYFCIGVGLMGMISGYFGVRSQLKYK